MENGNDQKQQDRRKTSPIRGGKGKPKPGAGRRNTETEPSSRPEGLKRGVRSLFMEFENAAEQRIRRVIEEEMTEAETRILRRLTGRRETKKVKAA